MLNIEELRTQTQVATAVAALMGTAASANLRRYIYKIKTVNGFAGQNELTLNRGTALAAGAEIDTIQHAILGDTYVDPESLTVDAAPVYILEAGTYLWVTTSAGNCDVTIWYQDAP